MIAARQAGLLVNGGGHAMAAGLTVARDSLPELGRFLDERIAPQLGAAPPVRELGSTRPWHRRPPRRNWSR